MSALAKDVYNDTLRSGGWSSAPVSGSSYSDFDVPAKSMFVSRNISISGFAFTNKFVKANKPITLKIYKDDGAYVVENEKLHVFACGSDVEDAVNDFLGQLVYFYEYYRGLTENDVIGHAVELKNIYDTQFQEEAL